MEMMTKFGARHRRRAEKKSKGEKEELVMEMMICGEGEKERERDTQTRTETGGSLPRKPPTEDKREKLFIHLTTRRLTH